MRNHGYDKSGNYCIKKCSIDDLENGLAAYFGVKHAILTTSATMGLTLALKAVNAENKVVAVPSFTFIASAFAATCIGSEIKFVDVNTNNICSELGDFVSGTKMPDVIMAVHIGGASCNMDELVNFCKANGIPLIEDAAQAIGSMYKGRKLGALGDIGVVSFGRSKLVTGGEGGAILTNHDNIAEYLRALINFGVFNNSDPYKHNITGFNGKISEIQASLIMSQLPTIDTLAERRHANQNLLKNKLGTIRSFVAVEPLWNELCNCYMFMIRYIPKKNNQISRDKLCMKFRENGLPVAASEKFPYPIYKNPCYGINERLCPTSEMIYQEIITIGHPSSSSLFNLEQSLVEVIADKIIAIAKKEGVE